MSTFWLSTQLGYACRHSGACCTAGWPIPIERDRAAAITAAVAARLVDAPSRWYEPEPDAPAEMAGVLGRNAEGACVFYRSPAHIGAPAATGSCTIHALRPVSCRHFPYVCVVDPRGVHVTLSHFCPTVASLLFDAEGEVAVVEGPQVPIDGVELEGLDARESLPPVAPRSPRAPEHSRLLSWDAVTQWEHALVARLAGDTQVPDPPCEAVFERARAATAPGWSWPRAPAGVAAAWNALVAPGWGRWARVIGRYLAARAHASWAMYLGDGPTDVERLVELSRTVLQVEASRACLERRAGLDRPALTEAVRRADLLLLHYADPVRLLSDP